MSNKKTVLVVSAHAADFVWRAGGAIALHTEQGYDVTVVCLSYGERGESAKLWKQETMTLEQVKEARKAEANRHAMVKHIKRFSLEQWRCFHECGCTKHQARE